MYSPKLGSICEIPQTPKRKTPQKADQFLSKEPRLVPVTHLRILVLNGHCHTIEQLYKKLEGVYASTESQN